MPSLIDPYNRLMQVMTGKSQQALARHRQKLRNEAQADRARADKLESEGNQALDQAEVRQQSAADNRQKGQELKNESNRLRRNGRDQSRRGLERLSDGSDRYSESFAKQEQGLADLQQGLDTVTQANGTKTEALDKINGGLAEQAIHNASQSADLATLNSTQAEGRALSDQKEASLAHLQDNNSAQGNNLNLQTERVADYLLAGDDFQKAGEVKESGVAKLDAAITHDVKAESHKDTQAFHGLQQTWGEEDAARHQKSEQALAFSAMFESLKSQASKLNAAFHQRAADRGEGTAQELDAQASGMRAQADQLFVSARHLEHVGQHHLAVGRQMKCCPWTYCQGLALEQQGCAEIAEAQRMKVQAQEMRCQAQDKAMEAEEARVRAEQAREAGEELEVQGHGQEIRSNILQERSDSHEERGAKASQHAEQSAQKAETAAASAQNEKAQASELRQEGLGLWNQGIGSQWRAVGAQSSALQSHRDSVVQEKDLQKQASEETGAIAEALSGGRRALASGGAAALRLNSSVSGERDSQSKVQDGIDQFQGGLDTSVSGAAQAGQAADMLKEARELELEGLRLQNRGQKMMLEARPKMANAAKLSAQSFDAFKKAQRQEEEAEKLILAGTEKLEAAQILRTKAEAYEQLLD